jgi:uncharacterized repeat protein (TIGR03803 family)
MHCSAFLKAFSKYWLLIVTACIFAFNGAPLPLHAQIYTDLHDFDCSVEGCAPTFPEVLAQGRDGNLYGTARNGGTSDMGTVFKVTPSGTVTTLYNFSGSDGANPTGGLSLGLDGNFYGTTSLGGTNNLGTIFKITPAGALTTLHTFTGSDGSGPIGAPVLGKNGSFYGTTCGFNPPWTGYSITSSGAFKTLNNATPPCSFAPFALGNDGNLYGTSQVGGLSYEGTVFRMTPSGVITVLYNFDNTHGAYLYSPVVAGNDNFLYGTTSGGGSGGAGVVFKLSAGGQITLLHQFDENGSTDGGTPFAGLVAASDNKLYGATSGGASVGSVPDGNLFQVTRAGSYSLLYAFDNTHGSLAEATPMQHTNGKIYGLTQKGGGPNGNLNDGVVYSLDNGLPTFVALVNRWGTSGQTVQILGQGLTGTTSVKFGTASATFKVYADTFMTATIPANGVSGFITVTSPSGTLTSNRPFNIAPVINSFTPTSGPIGTVVTITGSGFNGATVITFGGVRATTFTVNSGTQISATVPTGAATGNIGVKTPGGNAASAGVFTVIP